MEEITALLMRIAEALEESNTITKMLAEQQERWHEESTTQQEQLLQKQMQFIAEQNVLQAKRLQPIYAFTPNELLQLRLLDVQEDNE